MPNDTPPSPFHLLRHHSHPLHCLAFSSDNALLYSGDEEGWVAVTDLRRRRVVAHWKAHEGGVLQVGEWQGGLVSHGRDNQILFHAPFDRFAQSLSVISASTRAGSVQQEQQPAINSIKTSLTPMLPPPVVKHALPVNALNFCGFAIVKVPSHEQAAFGEDTSRHLPAESAHGSFAANFAAQEGLLAVPNLTDSETVDIYHLPSMQRLHAAVTSRFKPKESMQASVEDPHASGKEPTRSGLVMSIHAYFSRRSCASATDPSPTGSSTPSASDKDASSSSLNLVVAFEDGRVERWECAAGTSQPRSWFTRSDARMNIGAGLWQCRWSEKVHHEAVMDMVARTGGGGGTAPWAAFSVSADHQLVRYSLDDVNDAPRVKTQNMKQIGNSCVSITADGRVVAVGGWDGCIRLFSAKSLKPLGTLDYHRDQCRCLAFPAASTPSEAPAPSSDSDEDDDEPIDASRWMASGGKDHRVVMWKLKDFSRP